MKKLLALAAVLIAALSCSSSRDSVLKVYN